MIERLELEIFKKFVTKRSLNPVVVCLGNQQPSTGTGYSDAKRLFNDLGYTMTLTIDYDGSADITHDLNYPLPDKLTYLADLVYDGGTCEHVANIGEAFSSIVKLTKLNGYVVQQVPVNASGTSYYGIDPMLLKDFYELNGFETLYINLYCRENIELKVLDNSSWLPTKVLHYWRHLLAKFAAFRGLCIGDDPYNIKFYDPYSTHRKVPPTTFNLYVGMRRSITFPNIIKWPHQSIYPSRMNE